MAAPGSAAWIRQQEALLRQRDEAGQRARHQQRIARTGSGTYTPPLPAGSAIGETPAQVARALAFYAPPRTRVGGRWGPGFGLGDQDRAMQLRAAFFLEGNDGSARRRVLTMLPEWFGSRDACRGGAVRVRNTELHSAVQYLLPIFGMENKPYDELRGPPAPDSPEWCISRNRNGTWDVRILDR